MRWEHFEHGADLGVRGIGRTPAEAFAAAAVALTAAIADPDRIRRTLSVDVACDGTDLAVLLYDWLNRVIYEMATRRAVFASFDVRIEAGGLRARLHGEPVDAVRHAPAVEPKGATFTALEVARDAGGFWRAQCVVDV